MPILTPSSPNVQATYPSLSLPPVDPFPGWAFQPGKGSIHSLTSFGDTLKDEYSGSFSSELVGRRRVCAFEMNME